MLSTPLFSLDHGPAWVDVTETDQEPPSYQLISEQYRCSATLSGQFVVDDKVNLETLAQRLLDVRVEAEKAAMAEAGREVEISEAIKALPFGHQIEYFGCDSCGRNLRYLGIVVRTKVVNVYVETHDLSADGLGEVFRELLRGLRL